MSKKDNIINYITDKIIKGEWKIGTKIPTEEELTKILNVSRTTLRFALSELAQKKVIEKKFGVGNFVKIAGIKDKYIIIEAKNIFTKINTFVVFQNLVGKLKDIFSEMGYNVYIHQSENNQNFFNIINIKPENIAGVISVNGLGKITELEKSEIPIVQVLPSVDYYYSVSVDYNDFFIKINKLIQENNINKALFFMHEHNQNYIASLFYFYGVGTYYSKNHIISFVNNVDSNIEKVRIIMDSIEKHKDEIDSIIFTDDAFIKPVLPYLSNKKILDKKIITHSNFPEFDAIYPNNICRLEIDLDEIVNKSVQLLVKLINKEYVMCPKIYVAPKIINENVLKNNTL